MAEHRHAGERGSIEYTGSTFLTFAGEKIDGLRTYYDSAAFLDVPAGTL